MKGIRLAAAVLAIAAEGCFGNRLQAQFYRVDPAFVVNLDGPVYAIAVQSDGKIVIGGAFTNVNGLSARHLARLNSDGSLDGSFVAQGESPTPDVARPFFLVLTESNIYASFLGPIHRYSSMGFFEREYLMYSTFVVDTNRRVIYGRHTEYLPYERVRRFNEDGSLDRSFYVIVGCCHNQGVNAVALQDVGGEQKILIGGGFDEVNANAYFGLARLNDDGWVDTNFQGRAGSPVNDIRFLPDGRFYTAMDLSLARYMPDGKRDPTFAEVKAKYGDEEFLQVTLLNDGGALVLAQECTFTCTNMVRRFKSNGDADTNFTVWANYHISTTTQQTDGAILIGGMFTNINCFRRTYLARLIPSDAPDVIDCLPPPPKPEPELTTTRLRLGRIVCCWPTNYPEYTLQAARVLHPKHPDRDKWKTVTNAPAINGDHVCMTNRVLRWGRNYRLVRQ